MKALRRKVHGIPLSGSRAQVKPYSEPMTPDTSEQAERLLSKPPSPFANPQGAVHRPAPTSTNVGGAAQPKGQYIKGVSSMDAAPWYNSAEALIRPAAVGDGMPKSGKGAPYVQRGVAGHLAGAAVGHKADAPQKGPSGHPTVKAGRSAFFGG